MGVRVRRVKKRVWPRQVSALLVLMCAAAVPGGGHALADGAGSGGLELRVSVNSRPGTEALRPGIRVGDPVRTVYRLINHTGADLHDVRVTDPALPPGTSISCGGRSRVAMLRGISSTTCEAETRARAGVWTGEVTAVGSIPSLHLKSRARARAGYRGVGGVLTLDQSVEAAGRRAVIRYAVANEGNRTLYDVRVGDALPGARAVDCGGGRPVVARLAPGDSASCRSTVRGEPGGYLSEGRAGASDRTRTLGRRGDLLPPPHLTARSSVRFVLRDAPVEADGPADPPRDQDQGQNQEQEQGQEQSPGREREQDQGQDPTADESSLPPADADAPSLPPAGPDAQRPKAPLAPFFPFAPPAPLPPAALLKPPVGPLDPYGPLGPVVPFTPFAPPGAAPPPGVAPPAPVPPAPLAEDEGSAAARTRPHRAARDVPFLERFYRPGQGPTRTGLVAILFLVVLPAVLAAVLLGSRLR